MSDLKRKASQAAITDNHSTEDKRRKTTSVDSATGHRPNSNLHGNEENDGFTFYDDTEELDDQQDKKEVDPQTQLRLIVTGRLPPDPAINRVQIIFTASENEWKTLVQRQHPRSEVRDIIYKHSGVREVLYGPTNDELFARQDHRINFRIKKLKLRLRTAEDIRKLKDKTPAEKARAEGAMMDLLGSKSQVLQDIWNDIEFLSRRGEEGRKAARDWRRELLEMEPYFGSTKPRYDFEFPDDSLDP